MTTNQDFLTQTLRRVARGPCAGAPLDTEILGPRGFSTAGISARAVLAAIGRSKALSTDGVAMAESELFEFDHEVTVSGSDVWEVKTSDLAPPQKTLISEWQSLGLAVGDVAVFPEEMIFAAVTKIANVLVAGRSLARIEFESDLEFGPEGSETSVSSQRASISSLAPVFFALDIEAGSLILDGVYPGFKRGGHRTDRVQWRLRAARSG